mmetsp:Transcript_90185/g.141350  ORF Transcript_90185/g.141350 Transcript_90185/m.141350 type:complete len:469 (-) Transcript_90185:626-2032(-)
MARPSRSSNAIDSNCNKLRIVTGPEFRNSNRRYKFGTKSPGKPIADITGTKSAAESIGASRSSILFKTGSLSNAFFMPARPPKRTCKISSQPSTWPLSRIHLIVLQDRKPRGPPDCTLSMSLKSRSQSFATIPATIIGFSNKSIDNSPLWKCNTLKAASTVPYSSTRRFRKSSNEDTGSANRHKLKNSVKSILSLFTTVAANEDMRSESRLLNLRKRAIFSCRAFKVVVASRAPAKLSKAFGKLLKWEMRRSRHSWSFLVAISSSMEFPENKSSRLECFSTSMLSSAFKYTCSLAKSRGDTSSNTSELFGVSSLDSLRGRTESTSSIVKAQVLLVASSWPIDNSPPTSVFLLDKFSWVGVLVNFVVAFRNPFLSAIGCFSVLSFSSCSGKLLVRSKDKPRLELSFGGDAGVDSRFALKNTAVRLFFRLAGLALEGLLGGLSPSTSPKSSEKSLALFSPVLPSVTSSRA